jgi:hypothetical protein
MLISLQLFYEIGLHSDERKRYEVAKLGVPKTSQYDVHTSSHDLKFVFLRLVWLEINT